MNLWSRSNVELGQVWVRDGLAYRVVALIDEPVAVLVPLDDRDGDDREYHVIGSPNFTEFHRLEERRSDGSIQPMTTETGS